MSLATHSLKTRFLSALEEIGDGIVTLTTPEGTRHRFGTAGPEADLQIRNWRLLPRLALRARTLWYEPLPWVAYRQRGSSILSQMTPAKARDLSGALTTFRHALQGTEWDTEPAVRFAVAH